MAVPPLADALENLLREFDLRLAASAEELRNEVRRLVAQKEGAAGSPAAEEFGHDSVGGEKWPRQPSRPRSAPSPSPRAKRAARVPLLGTTPPATPRWIGERTPTTFGHEPVHPAELSPPPGKMHGDPLWTALQNLRQQEARAPWPHSPPSQQRWPHEEEEEEEEFEEESSCGSFLTGHPGGHDSGAGLLSADHTGGHESHLRATHTAGSGFLDYAMAQLERQEAAERKKAAAQAKGMIAEREEGAERK
jgi:hypothetical protein